MENVKKILGRVGIFFGSTLGIVLVAFLMMLFLMMKGPSTQIRNLLVASLKESSAGGILVDIFFSQEEVEAILAENSMIPTGGIVVEFEDEDVQAGDTEVDEEQPDIEIVDVFGPLYKGRMMIVKDPSRVVVGTCDRFDPSARGLTLLEIVEKYGAVGGVNGGRFTDSMGFGKGGCPVGIVCSQGKLVFGDLNATYEVYGFDKNNKFVIGKMTGQEAIDRGIRDAVTFGPALVVNGKAVAGGSGLNPRTAIGQRADGSVLLLVIEGRQTNSLGATYSDLVNIMLEFGAVNAANLDGGMSSSMVYDGKEISTNDSNSGVRDIPTAFIIMPKEED